MRFFVIHGAYGKPDENWFPWIKEELEKQGNEVIIPEFPTPKYQELKNWEEMFKPYLTKVDADTVFIGHSLGCAFILSVLEDLNVKIKACFFVAGFASKIGNDDFDTLNKSFIDKKFDWDKIRKNCSSFTILQSSDDPYVPIQNAKELATNLDSKVTQIKSAGNFNASAGYSTFPELLEIINKSM